MNINDIKQINIEDDNAKYFCPSCGENERFRYFSIINYKGVDCTTFTITTEDKKYDIDKFKCYNCGRKWESKPYNIRGIVRRNI